MVRTKGTARVRPSDAQVRTGATRRVSGFPTGVSKTLSGKFQARIKLNGKRYDLGSNFTTPEEAGAAYQAAWQAGTTDRASPQHARVKRGTGTSCLLVILLTFLCFSPFALSCVNGRRKGFGAHHSAPASARGAFPWLPGEPAATRTACSCAVARWSIGSKCQPSCRFRCGAACRVPRSCPSGRDSQKPVSALGAWCCCASSMLVGLAAVRSRAGSDSPCT